ncbi:MAG: hypothetical protein ACJA01_001246 [Saprospiraceae bacterium]|jgi:hypothetical protein
MKLHHVIFLSILLLSLEVFAQRDVNYEEDKIPSYQLPDLLILSNGEGVEDVDDWEQKRRPEILKLFKDEVYGSIPNIDLSPTSIEILESNSALDGTAVRRQIAIDYNRNGKDLRINVLLYLPKGIASPPMFVGYDFYGNQTVIDDPNIVLTNSWVRNNKDMGITDNSASETSRGKRSHRWAIPKIISEGFGIALIYYGDVDPDKDDLSDGVHALLYEDAQVRPKEDEWGAISAWAWGFSEVLSVLIKDDALIESKFISFGHSRLGKTSLWAGALDERFDLVISNDSGCGGAALFRRKYGETAAVINKSFPHWFNANFKKYSANEDALPVDQHMLIALMAPRPVYIASAEDDRWADPKGEHLSGYHASPIYELYGQTGLINPDQPQIHEPTHNSIGYHIRAGKHDVTAYDWEQFIKFAKGHFNE